MKEWSRSIIFLIVSLHLCSISVYSQKRNIRYYLDVAYLNNASLKENVNLNLSTDLDFQLAKSIFAKPQINFTTDYLFVPYINDKGMILNVTQQPESKSYGYDVALSNGGLYSSQLNFSFPLFKKKLIDNYFQLFSTQTQYLTFSRKKIKHDLDSEVTSLYISAWLLQKQFEADSLNAELLKNRLPLLEALIQKSVYSQSDLILFNIQIQQKIILMKQEKLDRLSAFIQLNNICGIVDSINYPLANPDLLNQEEIQKGNNKMKYELDSLTLVLQSEIYNRKFKPQLTTFANAGLNAVELNRWSHYLGFSAGLNLFVPIYDGNQKKKRTLQNKLLLEITNDYYFQREKEFTNNLSATKKQIIGLKEILNQWDDLFENQRKLNGFYEMKLKVGQISVIDYLKSIENLSLMERERIGYQAKYWNLVNSYNYYNW